MTDLVDEILTAKGMRGRGKRRKMIPNRASNPLAWVPEK
jgi:hypothetical protein